MLLLLLLEVVLAVVMSLLELFVTPTILKVIEEKAPLSKFFTVTAVF